MVATQDIQIHIKQGVEVNIMDGNRYYADQHWYVVRDGSNKAERVTADQLPPLVLKVMEEEKSSISPSEFYETYLKIKNHKGEWVSPRPLNDSEKAFLDSATVGSNLHIFRKRSGHLEINVGVLKEQRDKYVEETGE